MNNFSRGFNDICAIGVDWGTTNMRAWAFDSEGGIVDRRSSGDGILTVANKEFENTLMGCIGDWLESSQQIPIIASGMIGSRQGWVEIDYSHCPVHVAELIDHSDAQHRARSQLNLKCGNPVMFVGGVRYESEAGLPDVMRGEETQIAGLVATGSQSAMTVVLPGTHSKWVEVDQQRIIKFDTYMTGELFAVLTTESILKHSVSCNDAQGATTRPVGEAFDQGVKAAEQTDGRFLNRIFHTRTLSLSGRLSPEQGWDYLSGLLIGSELREGFDKRRGTASKITLLGAGELVTRYARAFEILGQPIEVAPASTTVRGLWMQYQSYANSSPDRQL